MRIAETDRTVIDTIQLTDALLFVALVNTPEWLEFIGDRGVENVERACQSLNTGFLKSYVEHGFSYDLIRDRHATELGICGFLKRPELKNADFGFALLPEFFGQGFGFEAATAVLEFGIKQFQFQVVDAVTNPENTKSKRLLTKLGFQPNGTMEIAGVNDSLDLFCFQMEAGHQPDREQQP